MYGDEDRGVTILITLLTLSGPGKGRRLMVGDKSLYRIGGSGSCDLVLEGAADGHAEIRVLPGGQLELCPGGALTVNGRPVNGPLTVAVGDRIEIAGSLLQLFHTGSADASPPESAVRVAARAGYQPADAVTRTVDLGHRTITIGREEGNDLVLNHPMVSRRHARLTVTMGGWRIEDLQSTNGTYVDGNLLRQPMVLKPGNLITIGGYRLIFDGRQLNQYDDNDGRIRLDIRNLTRTVTAGSKVKTLLDDVSLTVEPKEFVAILGGSGAGKSTLLGALTGMAPANAGSVLVNGIDLYREYAMVRSIIGYVPQDDIIHMELRVEEVLTYAARLRMPEDMDDSQISALIDSVLAELELTRHRQTLVRELSGGQRKRVSIGVELLTRPSLFFLDEPTSGLDPGLERVMMELLRKLARQGRTVVLVTHATVNIHLCDKVVFLARGGKLAFCGSPAEALEYFQCRDFAEVYKLLDNSKTPDDWARQYAASSLRQRHAGPLQAAATASDALGAGHRALIPAVRRGSALRQWWILTRRYLTIFSRDRRNLLVLLAQGVIIPAVIVAIFWQGGDIFAYSRYQAGELLVTPQVIAAGEMTQVTKNMADETKRFSNMVQCVSMLLYTAILLGASNAAREIVKERGIYRRERLANLKLHPYLLSKVTVLLAVCGLQSLLLVGITIMGLGLPEVLPSFLSFFLIFAASMLMGLTLSATVSNADKAGTAVILILIPQIILSGAVVPLSELKPESLQALGWLMVSKWGLGLVSGVVGIPSRIAPDIEGSLLRELTSYGVLFNSLVLALFILIFYVWAALSLRRTDSRQER